MLIFFQTKRKQNNGCLSVFFSFGNVWMFVLLQTFDGWMQKGSICFIMQYHLEPLQFQLSFARGESEYVVTAPHWKALKTFWHSSFDM